MASKEVYIAEMEKGKNEIEVKFFKARRRSIGKSPLSGEKHILWDQLLVEVTKFREYLNLVEDERDLIKTCNKIYRLLQEEMELRLV